MKRMLLSGTAILMASAAFASPALATDTTIAAPCGGEPLVECVRKVLASDIAPPCYSQSLTECAREVINRVIDRVNQLGYVVGNACEIIFPDCGTDALLPDSLPPIGG